MLFAQDQSIFAEHRLLIMAVDCSTTSFLPVRITFLLCRYSPSVINTGVGSKGEPNQEHGNSQSKVETPKIPRLTKNKAGIPDVPLGAHSERLVKH